MKKINFVVIILLIVAIAFEAINIYLSNKLAADSISVKKLEGELSNFEQKNRMVKSELLELTSFEQIASRAAEAGFVEVKEIITLSSPLQVAVNR